MEYGLGNLKDRYFIEQLEQYGVDIYEAAIALVRTLREHEIKTAVVCSSNNCAAVLEAVGIAQLFDMRVDGLDTTRLSQGQDCARCFSGSSAAARGGTVSRRGG